MDIKRLCLFAGLLALPVASYASYADGSITITYRLDLTNFPAGNRLVVVHCEVGVGPPSATALASWDRTTLIGQGAQTFEVPSDRRLLRSAAMSMTATSASPLDEATHYKCRMSGAPGEPAFRGAEVSGVIPR
jgi:hypothetical protein